MSISRESRLTLAQAALAACIGGGFLYLLILSAAVPDCTAKIHQEKWSIFINGALPAAGAALLLAKTQDRWTRMVALRALGALFGSMLGYWSVDATDDDSFGSIENTMVGAAAGLMALFGGLGIAAVSGVFQRGRRLLFGRWHRAPALASATRVTLRRVTWLLGVGFAGLLMSGSGLLPVRVTRRGLWLTRHHGQGADLRGAVLFAADLSHVDLQGADLRGADMHGAELRGASLWTTRLTDANLRRADLRGISGVSADLRGAALDGADLAGASLTGADLSSTKLTGAHLAGSIYDQRTQWPAGFDPRQGGAIRLERGAKLHGANLRHADLKNDDLRGADLSATNLTGVGLNYADLRGASLRGAIAADERAEWYDRLNLSGADLRAADLTGAEIDNESADVTGAVYDSRTRWPAGFDPGQAGAVER